ncbi:hypothetical protein Ancab_030611 [Ancistrocladus abbreviatus]
MAQFRASPVSRWSSRPDTSPQTSVSQRGYQETCEKSLTSSSGNDTDPKELVKMAFKLAKEEVAFALNRSKAIRAAANDPRAKQGLEICHEVINYAVGDLERSLESMGNFSYSNLDDFLEDLSVWIGGAATYQDAYFDAFDNATSNAGLKMRELFNTSRQLTSISLSMVSEIKQLVSTLNIPILLGGRHLLQETAALPQARALLAWISAQRCNIMKTPISTLQKKWN